MSGELHKRVNVSEVLEVGDNAVVSEAGSGDLDALSIPSGTEPIEPDNEVDDTADQSEATEVPDGTAESTAETEANNVSVPSNEAEVVSEESILNAIGAEKALGFTIPAEHTAAEVIPVDSALVLAEDEYAETVADKIYSRLEYQDIYQNTYLVFELHSNLVKESIVINQYDSTLYGYTYLLNVGQMVPVLQETGEIALYDEEREELIMIMPAPYLVDAPGEYCDDIQISLNETANGYVLSYFLPKDWMAEEMREWPVVLDPAVTPNLDRKNIRDVTISTGGALNHLDNYLHCGYCRCND